MRSTTAWTTPKVVKRRLASSTVRNNARGCARNDDLDFGQDYGTPSEASSRFAVETVEAARPCPQPGKPYGFPTAPTVPTTTTTTTTTIKKKLPDHAAVTHVPGLICYPSARLFNPVGPWLRYV